MRDKLDRDLVAYGLLLLAIAVLVIIVLWLSGPAVSQIFSDGYNLQGT